MNWMQDQEFRGLQTYFALKNFHDTRLSPAAIFDLIRAERALGIPTYNGPLNTEWAEAILKENLHITEAEINLDVGPPEGSFQNPIRIVERMSSRFHVYSIFPIDEWFGAASLEEMRRAEKNRRRRETMEFNRIRKLGDRDAEEAFEFGAMDGGGVAPLDCDLPGMERIAACFDIAATALGQDNDWRMEHPRFGPVTGPDGEYMFCRWGARKLNNNGTTIATTKTTTDKDQNNNGNNNCTPIATTKQQLISI